MPLAASPLTVVPHLCHWWHLPSRPCCTYATPTVLHAGMALVASPADISSYAAGLFVKSETYDLGSESENLMPLVVNVFHEHRLRSEIGVAYCYCNS